MSIVIKLKLWEKYEIKENLNYIIFVIGCNDVCRLCFSYTG